MPRGGSGKGGHNPFFGGDNNISVTSEELAALTTYAESIFHSSKEKPNLFDPDDTERAVMDYFRTCRATGVRPSNLGMYAALGLTRQEVNAMIGGKCKNRVSPASVDVIKRARLSMSAYRESLAMAGKLNPGTAIFWAKNFDGMEDVTRLEVTPDKGPAADMTPEEIAAQIERDIPIDTEYKDIDQE